MPGWGAYAGDCISFTAASGYIGSPFRHCCGPAGCYYYDLNQLLSCLTNLPAFEFRLEQGDWIDVHVWGDPGATCGTATKRCGTMSFTVDVGVIPEPPAIHYVDVNAGGTMRNGTSWTMAFAHLQDALAVASAGDEIWVADGTYKPDRGAGIQPGDRTATFQLINGVTIKGGYAGFGEPDPNARDIDLYETILCGDLNGDDGPDFTNNGENSIHVVNGSGTDATAVLDGFTITAGNAISHLGAGMFNEFGSPTVIGCTFINNAARGGGGMFNISSSPKVINCTFNTNIAEWSGGGMFNGEDSFPMVVNCLFTHNLAEGTANAIWGGGGMFNDYASPTLINCTFCENSAYRGGGMLTAYGFSTPLLTNCIFWANMAQVGPQIELKFGSMPIVLYSNVQGGWSGEGNIDADPLFVDTASGDYHLLPDSPCIDAGDNSVIPPSVLTDLDGNPRITYGTVDMGAYEFQGPRNFYVDDDAPNDPAPGDPNLSDPLEDGTQAHPFDVIQEAIDVARHADTIIVAEGTYVENIYFKGKNTILRSTSPDNPEIVAATIIDGSSNPDSVVTFTGTENETCVLSGFTMCNGNDRWAGGICGGSEEDHARATIQNNIITHNVAWDAGGLSWCDGLIENNTITSNTAHWCVGGGGLYQCDGIIRSNLIAGNFSGGCESGGGLSRCDGTIENNTITGNFSYGYHAVAQCHGTIRNCIIWENSPVQTSWWSIPSFSCIQGWSSGDYGNIDADPCFIHPGYWEDPYNTPYDPWDDVWIDGDYHLLPNSPCINAGDPDYIAAPNETDLDGLPRVIGGRIDMGACEFQNTPPVADAGPDQIVECACNTEEGTKVILDGTGSYDADGDPLTYTWTGPFVESPVHGATPIVTLEGGCPGEYVITLVVNDGTDESEPNDVVITVVDTTPPEFQLSVAPTMLWPPDHKMVLITPSWTVRDDCVSTPQVSLVSIVANEGDDTIGDGHTSNDIQIGEDGSIYLRSERSGTSSDRIYTITYQAIDDCENTTVRSATVSIPHDFKVLARIAAQWLWAGPGRIPEDLNGDGVVNLKDIAIFANNWIQ
ncbi:MAG: choice-of-anchor Q domain-containing protein [Planctomycetota bacterium]